MLIISNVTGEFVAKWRRVRILRLGDEHKDAKGVIGRDIMEMEDML